MRTVSQAFIDDLTNTRVIGANAVFRDTRLRFTYTDKLSSDAELFDTGGGTDYPVKSIDSCVHGTGILRVANISGSLKRMWHSSLPNWPASWTSVTTGLLTGSGVGIHSSRCFYQKTDGKIYYRDWDGSAFSGEAVFDSRVYDPCGIAPVSTSEIFLMEKLSDNYADLYHTDGSTRIKFEGHIYQPSPTTTLLDAENLDGTSYVFFATHDEKRPWMISYRGGNWSQVTPVIPLDIVDDDTSFRFAGVEAINGQIVLSGARQSSTGDAWLFYSFGPAWTMGRDCFISKEGAEWEGYEIGGDGIPPWGGKLHLLSNTVYVLAPGRMYSADATTLLGVDNATYKKDMTGDIRKVNLSFNLREPGRATFEIPASTSHQAVRVGSDVDLSVSVGGHSADVCRFNVDAIVNSIETDGQSKTVVATSKGLKNLAKWAPDLNYDMWGQGKSVTNPATLMEVIRVNGDWEVDEAENALKLNALNERSIMYSTVRPSRNAIVQGRFKFTQEAANHDVEFGLLLNYYRETKEQAMARLGKTEDEIRWWDYGDNGLAVVWGTKVHDPFGTPSPGFGIYWFYDNSWFQLSSYTWSVNLSEDTWYWIQAEFFEGNIRILYRAEGSTTWTLVGKTYVFESSTELPWNHGYSGRAGLYMHNITPYSSSPMFNSETLQIPVSSVGTLPAPETYIADSEQMTISAKSNNRTLGGGLIAREGYTLEGAEHSNPYTGPWDGYEIYCQGSTAVTDHDYYDGLALVVTGGQGMGEVFKVTDWDYIAPKQWVPSQQYTLPDTWMDHVGEADHGSWVEDDTLQRVFVEEDPDGKTGEDSTFALLPALTCTARGANGTTPVGHSNNTYVHVYKPASIYCDNFRAFTGDIDMSITDIFYELSRRAGNLTPHIDYYWEGSQSGYGWSPSTAIANGTHQQNFVVRLRRISGEPTIGVYFNLYELTGYRGEAITVSNTEVNYYTIEGTQILQETVPIDNDPKLNWITFSIDQGKYSVWINNRLVAVFANLDYPTIGDLGGWFQGKIRSNFFCDSGSSVYLQWPRISGRVDNFIMDMGKGGGTMLERLIGDKHIYWIDDQSGNTKLFRTGDTIDDDFELAVAAGETSDEQGLVTRARVEGMEAYEVADAAAMKEHGNVFRNINNEDVQTTFDAAEEANYYIILGGKQVDTLTASGAGDPRIEPGDKIGVTLPSGTTDITVERVLYKLDIDKRNALFDMTIEGY